MLPSAVHCGSVSCALYAAVLEMILPQVPVIIESRRNWLSMSPSSRIILDALVVLYILVSHQRSEKPNRRGAADL